MAMMLLRRRLPLLRLIRPRQAAPAPYTSTSSACRPHPSQAPLEKPPVTTSSSDALGSRLGFLNAKPLASARGDSASSSYSIAAYLAIGAAAALGSLPVAYVDANEQGSGAVDKEAKAGAMEGEDLARKERKRIMELIQKQGMHRGSYPRFDAAVKGQKVVVKFNMPSTCNVSHLIVDLVTHIGLEAEQLGGGSEVLVRAWDSAAARQITLNPRKKTSVGDRNEDDLCVLIFEPLIGSEYSEVEFIKPGSFSLKENLNL